MKRLIFLLLLLCLLLSFSACSSNTEPNPYSVNVLYQTDDHTSRFIYSFTIGQYVDIGAPEFMGIPLAKGFDGHYLLLSSGGSMEYQEKPFRSIEGTLLENGIPLDQKQQLIQSIQQTDPSLLEGWDQDSILVRFSCNTDNGMVMVFTDTLHNPFVHIAEFDTDGTLMRLVEVEKLNNAMLHECTVRERTPS